MIPQALAEIIRRVTLAALASPARPPTSKSHRDYLGYRVIGHPSVGIGGPQRVQRVPHVLARRLHGVGKLLPKWVVLINLVHAVRIVALRPVVSNLGCARVREYRERRLRSKFCDEPL